MPRTYANVVTAIWDNDSFRQLDDVDQRTYLMLVSQSDISAAGVLALRVRRWSSYARNTSMEDLSGSLARLAVARFILMDTDREELLVRSFVRHDKGYTNPKRRPAILSAALEVRSPILRLALASELHRLGLPTGELSDSLAEGLSDSHTDSLSAPRDDAEIDGALNTQVDSLSDSHTDTVSPSDRVVVIQGPYGLPHNPQPATPNPAHAGSAIAEGAATVDQEPPARDTPGSAALTFQAPSVVSTDPARGLTGSAGPPDDGALTRLVAEVRAIRPEWSERAIHRSLTHADVRGRPWELIQVAAVAVARDASTQAPGRIAHNGPWWQLGLPPKPPAEPCPTHRGQPARNCGPCRSEQLGGPS